MEKTRWYDGSVKPARDGVYERRFTLGGDCFYYAMFLQDKWRVGWLEDRFDNAVLEKGISIYQNDPWRGLTKEAK
jgi:hypothetical protein